MLSGRGRTTAMVSQNRVGKCYRGFEMQVKHTSFTFCSFLPLPNLKHEKENKVRPVIFLFSFFLPLKRPLGTDRKQLPKVVHLQSFIT